MNEECKRNRPQDDYCARNANYQGPVHCASPFAVRVRAAYLYLLQTFGLMEPTRADECAIKFLFSFLYLRATKRFRLR